jgi:hypothetical protein
VGNLGRLVSGHWFDVLNVKAGWFVCGHGSILKNLLHGL